ncbi:hypothetical protein GCK72_018360 [Caenorhabditis remanei]|uniref:C6 domain-containing protein n=1 Tax=Caenorhabditis remanei TaxID=31234 RepID=A0A6A5GAG2_CAERE|nr:hypothetical protein GCK72_018360 [Caenorhabditis remanei]KAF1751806.1 hypothetical protein GCK72_018360 [Caenorhabditis remanei]
MELATAPIRWSMDVTYSGYSYSQISGSSDAISTMSVRCSALTDYNVYMQFNGCQGGPLNNQNFPEGNDITLTCNSADMVWNYVVTLNGITYTRRIISVTCQRRCLPTDLPLESGETTTDREIEVTYLMYQTTQIPGTLDTTATMNLQCTADTGFFASMSINEGVEVAENVPPAQTVTISASCSSVDMVWQYTLVSMGVSTTVPLTRVWCQG